MESLVSRLRGINVDFSSRTELHGVMREAADEIDRLRLWVRRIDNINDDPSHFSTQIDRACIDALAGKPMIGAVTINEQTVREK
jgi:hypothetical protein